MKESDLLGKTEALAIPKKSKKAVMEVQKWDIQKRRCLWSGYTTED